tara:strand:- start:19873 stop:20553 length:681 start_codon:yes stop_codon:yes gene_type:complete
VYRYWLEMGHFHTSWLGTAAQFAAIGEEAPEVEQVSFAGKAPTYSFDVEHAGGMKAHVRAGSEDSGEVMNLGFAKVPKPGAMVGSVTGDGRLLGEIRFDGQLSPEGSSKAPGEFPIGSINCTVGEIEIVGRSEEVPLSSQSTGLEKGLEGLFAAGPNWVTEYRWQGQVVATMDGISDARITFEPELPVEGQICIASAMAIRLAQAEFARQQQLANDLAATSRILAR